MLTKNWSIVSLGSGCKMNAPFGVDQEFQINNGIYRVTSPASDLIPFKFQKFASDSVKVGTSKFSLFSYGCIGTQIGAGPLVNVKFTIPSITNQPILRVVTDPKTGFEYLTFETNAKGSFIHKQIKKKLTETDTSQDKKEESKQSNHNDNDSDEKRKETIIQEKSKQSNHNNNDDRDSDEKRKETIIQEKSKSIKNKDIESIKTKTKTETDIPFKKGDILKQKPDECLLIHCGMNTPAPEDRRYIVHKIEGDYVHAICAWSPPDGYKINVSKLEKVTDDENENQQPSKKQKT